jgi:hypothetical protein
MFRSGVALEENAGALLLESILGEKPPVCLVTAGFVFPTEVWRVRVDLLVSGEHGEGVVVGDLSPCDVSGPDGDLRAHEHHVSPNREEYEIC